MAHSTADSNILAGTHELARLDQEDLRESEMAQAQHRHEGMVDAEISLRKVK